MAWSRRNTIVRLVDPASSESVTLPVDNLTIRAVPYTGNQGTVIELHGGRKKFLAPTFGYRVELNWGYFRDEYKPNGQGTIIDAVKLLTETPTGLTFYAERYKNGAWNADRAIPEVIADIGEDTIQAIFSGTVRQKPTSLILVSRSSNYTIGDISWIL